MQEPLSIKISKDCRARISKFTTPTPATTTASISPNNNNANASLQRRRQSQLQTGWRYGAPFSTIYIYMSK